MIATVDSYLRAAGPRRRARVVASVGAAGVVLVLGFGAVARLAGLDAVEPHVAGVRGALTAIAAGLLGDLLRGRWSQWRVTGLVVDLGGMSEPSRCVIGSRARSAIRRCGSATGSADAVRR